MRFALVPCALFLVLVAVLLTGCAGQVQTATLTSDALPRPDGRGTFGIFATVSAAQTRLEAAITLYGISKGIAQVAAIADPGLEPVLVTVTASLDPLVARAKVTLDAAEVDAAAIEALAATITAQANALTLAAAPVIKVVPSGA